MEDKKIQAITKRPGCLPRSVSVSNNLKNLQMYVGGNIECVSFKTDDKEFVVICDEESRLKYKYHNCVVNGVDFVGDIVIVGTDDSGEDFDDLPFTFQEAKELLPGLWEE